MATANEELIGMELEKDKQVFRNQTSGQVGVITVNRRGEERAIAVAPGDTIRLSQEEQELTVAACSDPSKSPFKPHNQPILDEAGDITGYEDRPLLVAVTDKPEVPGIVGSAPEGSYDPREVMGTPVP